MVNSFIRQIVEWAKRDDDILCVLLADSDTPESYDSDSAVEFVIVSTNKRDMLACPDFVEIFGRTYNKRLESRGSCTTLIVWYNDGVQATFHLVEPSWFDLPMNPEMKDICDKHCKVLILKQRLLKGQ